MKAIVVLVLLAGVGAGVYFAFLQPTEIPERGRRDASGQRGTSTQLRGEGEVLLLAFLVPNCPLSKFTAGQMTELRSKIPQEVVFAGLVLGAKDQAAKLQQEWGLPFACYGLKDTPDPLALNELFEVVGTRNRVTGGTVLLIDAENKLQFKLEMDEVRELGDRLADAGY